MVSRIYLLDIITNVYMTELVANVVTDLRHPGSNSGLLYPDNVSAFISLI